MALYEVLGLTFEATQDDIKRSYKELSLKYHPDKNSEGKEKFQQVNESYKILANPHLRIIYNYGKLQQYLSMRESILSQLDNNVISKILVTVGSEVTSTYGGAEFKEDLNNKDIDKITAIFVEAYYEDDKVFKTTYVTIIASAVLATLILALWAKVKTISPYVFTGIICYYGFYRGGFSYITNMII